MPLLSIQDLYKTYTLGRVKVPVLRGVSMEVEEGEWVAILGASGSGKSTLLHLAGGLDRPDRRATTRIDFGGSNLASSSPRALDRYRSRSVGFVFQFYHLLPELTVLENVAVASMIGGGSSGSKRAARAFLEMVGLSHRLRHRPAELSGGERQRVAIARALVNEPALLLADEPTGNLDSETGGRILDALAEIREARGQTVVMVTHDHETAGRADRVVRLEDGRILNGPV